MKNASPTRQDRAVLYVEHYAGSPHHGMEFRPYYMARRWVSMGYRVVILAASFSHVRKHNPPVASAVTREAIDGIEYIWLKTPAYAGSGPGRVVNMGMFVYRAWRLRHRLGRIPGLRAVIASSTYPFDIYPARRIAGIAGARLIFEVHDLWPLSPMELGGYSRYHPFIILMQRAEDFAYREAHKVVSILPATLPYMVRHGMAPGKFVHIPNGIELDEPEEDKAGKPPGWIVPDAKLIVGYAGTLGVANAVEILIEAADLLRGERDVYFIIVGGGPATVNLKRLADAKGISNVAFHPPVNKRHVQSVLRAFDVCYIGMKRRSLYRFGISPNKLFDYMYAGRPVLQALDAANDLVREAGCGITVEPDDARAVAGAVLAFRQMTPQARFALGERGRRFVLAHHTYDRLASDFAELFAAPVEPGREAGRV